MIAPLLLLAAVLLLYRVHVRWGRADLRNIELQSNEAIWDEIEGWERDEEIADRAAREQARRLLMN